MKLARLLAAIGALWAGQAAASPPPAPAAVEIKPLDDGVEADFTLAAPVAKLALAHPAEAVRADTWRLLDPGLLLMGGVVSRADGKPLRRFAVKITPDTAPRDRSYPGLTPVGRGWQLYGPYLELEGRPVSLRAAPPLPRGWVLAPDPDGKRDPDGYVYLGPAAYATRDDIPMIVGPDVSASLKGVIETDAEQAAGAYRRRLGLELPRKPILIVARVPRVSRSYGWEGDVANGPVVSLRFFGETGWDEPDAAARADIARFVYHEFFHLWNARVARSTQGDTAPWLHEGMAEYAALLAALDDGLIDDAAMRKELTFHLNGCARILQGRGLKAGGPRQGYAVYDCGVLAEWMADLDARARGQADVFQVWRRLFAADKSGRRDYDVAAFLKAATGPEPDDPLVLLAEPRGPDGWERIAAALTARGAALEKTQAPDVQRAAMMMHLLGQACIGNRGFRTTSSGLALDTGDRCGLLNGDPVVDTVAGVDVMRDPTAAFDAVSGLCARGGEVALAGQGKSVGAVVCRAPLPATAAWAVAKWR